jgi:hypothetical protein
MHSHSKAGRMKKPSLTATKLKLPLKILKLIFLAAGGFLIYRKKEKILAFIQNKNFILTSLYAAMIGFMALIYRALVALNWLIQQAR